jgi:hypothetical protein
MYADDELYLVGDGTTIGWEGDVNQRQSTRMKEISSGVYVWTGLLKHGGEGFKIQEGTSPWDVRYCPSAENFAITQEGGSDTYQSANDWKWNPSDEGWKWYTITVDKNAKTLSWQAANPTLLVADKDGYFNIGTAEELNTLAFMCRCNVNNDDYKVRLTADIDYTAYKNGSLDAIGITEKYAPFIGEFDGQNHTVTIDLASYSTRTGFFGTIVGQVHNLKLAGKITATNKNQTSGFCGLLKGDGSKIYNCISTVEIVDTQSGDGTIGGFCSVTYNASTIENCAFYGKISASGREGNGGFVGWCNSGASTTIKNCLVVADINWKDGADFGRNNPSVINSYKSGQNDATLGNGQMTYKLNGNVSGAENWFQTLGTDAMPTPLSTSAKLYANGSFYCDGVTPKEGVEIVLSNENASIVDQHVPGEDGVCTGCHAVGKAAEAVDGVYQIVNAGNLLWWAQYVNAGHADANAVLTADVDLSAAKYIPAGNTDNVYVGTFDGQGHTVTLALNNPTLNYQGLFGTATDGATIKNVVVKGSVSGNSYVAGIVGGSSGFVTGKTLNIINCGNEATITAANANGAGIIGVNMTGAAHFYISNCYNVGNITSGRESGAITGWTGGEKSTFENVYNIGVVKNGTSISSDFVRGDGSKMTNCFNTSTNDTKVTSGELAYKLGAAFSQIIGTDAYPVFGNAPVSYVGEEGYATMFDTTTGYELNGDVEAYTATLGGDKTWIKLTEVENVPAGTPVILKGTYYNKVAKDLEPLNILNELKGAAVDTEATGSQYVLAKPENEEVGFYQATTGTIKAGKAFLELSDYPYVKAFFFAEEDATAINGPTPNPSLYGGEVYNLAGQKLSKLQKGINIVGGKKVLK